ncbi:class I SAM-dependent methyltransferase, partial [Dactylosporangium maewongense]|uniref:class I SAM-dependent methyltransferase n=1 Tax=Dactylosporangium maewongense TaxID=634393 RepID=UPI003CD08CAA
MFDDLAAAGVAPGARVLEIGCGTGQATVPLAERGYRIVAVEYRPGLPARRAGHPRAPTPHEPDHRPLVDRHHLRRRQLHRRPS